MELLYARGELSPYARRMAKHATHHATGRGRLDDVENGLIPGYKGRHGIGRRSAYTDLGRLREAGLLRQVHAACPGRGVAYQMCVPQTLPADLPAGIRAELRKRWARPSTSSTVARAAARRPAPPAGEAVRVRIPLAEGHRLMADVDTVRLGTLTAPPRETLPSRGGLHTCPFLKRALPQPRLSRSRQGSAPPSDPPMGRVFDREGVVIEEVISRCMALWGAQRPAGGLPDAQVMARLRPMLGSALCWHTSADVIEALTAQTRSARDLGAVAATRLRRMILAARRAARIAVDDDGARYRDLQDALAHNRAHAMDASADARRSARQALAAARDRHRAATGRPVPPRPLPRTPAPAPAVPVDACPAEDVLDSVDLRLLRQATANARTGTARWRTPNTTGLY